METRTRFAPRERRERIVAAIGSVLLLLVLASGLLIPLEWLDEFRFFTLLALLLLSLSLRLLRKLYGRKAAHGVAYVAFGLLGLIVLRLAIVGYLEKEPAILTLIALVAMTIYAARSFAADVDNMP